MKRLGIIRGGDTYHYEQSIREGGELISKIFTYFGDKWKPVDIFIDRLGVWHAAGIPVDPGELGGKADAFWDTTRSEAYMALPGLPVVNASGGSHSFRESGRAALKEHMKNIGVKTPRHLILPAYRRDLDGPLERYAMKKAMEVFEKFPPPWQVRLYPADSRGPARVAKTFPELSAAIAEGSGYERSILIEETVGGEKISTHSVLGFRGQDIYVFPPEGGRKEEKERTVEIAKKLHEYLPGALYLHSGYVFHPKRGAYLSGFELSPDFGKESLFEKACGDMGIKSHEIIAHMLDKC